MVRWSGKKEAVKVSCENEVSATQKALVKWQM